MRSESERSQPARPGRRGRLAVLLLMAAAVIGPWAGCPGFMLILLTLFVIPGKSWFAVMIAGLAVTTTLAFLRPASTVTTWCYRLCVAAGLATLPFNLLTEELFTKPVLSNLGWWAFVIALPIATSIEVAHLVARAPRPG